MKKFLHLFVFLLCLFMVACKKDKPEYYVIFVDGEGETLVQTYVKEGENVDKNVLSKDGYYYTYDFSDDELNNITCNTVLVIEYHQVSKSVKYFVDGEMIYQTTARYKDHINEPFVDTSNYESYKWVESLRKEEQMYYYEYNLEYVIKTEFNIEFYDGETKLQLDILKYDSKVETLLPNITKEGYEFIGWFLNDISLCNFTEIKAGTTGDIKLYARFIETESHNNIVLPTANANISKIIYNVNVWQPVMPANAQSTNVLDYDWYSSDESVFRVSAYSSISIVSSNCAILTGKLKTNPSYTINCIIKTTINKVEVVTEEVANNIEIVHVTFLGKDGELICKKATHKNGFVYYPDVPEYEGYYFAGWDKINYNITEDTTIQALYTTDIVNEYTNKTISFIGDSITSYTSYIPDGYATFFPYPVADVNDVNMMWWMLLCNKLGAKCFINDSYAGSCVQGGSEPTSSDKRLSHLKVGNYYADYTVIYMGSNDCAANKTYPLSYNAESFNEYYRIMIDKIKELCPNTKIILCTLAKSKLYQDAAMQAYNQVIRTIASDYDLQIIDLESVDLTQKIGGKSLIVDSAHPSFLGMQTLYNQMINELLK